MEDISGSLCSLTFNVKAGSSLVEVGCAFITPQRKTSLSDLSSHKLSLFQFEDSDFSNLESLIVRYSPVDELHYPSELSPDEEKSNPGLKTLVAKLAMMIHTTGVSNTFLHPKVKRGMEDHDVDFRTLVGDDNFLPIKVRLTSPEWKLSFVSALLLMQSNQFPEIEKGALLLEFGGLSQFMRLDMATTQALNLFPTKGDSNKEMSLFGILDRTMTKKIGSRLLHQWIKYPLCQEEAIHFRQKRVETLVLETEQREVLRSLLKCVPDLDLLSKKLRTQKAGLEDLYVLYLFANKFPDVIACTQQLQFLEETNRLTELAGTHKFSFYISFVEKVLDLQLAPREFVVRADNDSTGELATLLVERESLEKQLQREKEDLMDNDLCEFEAKWETDPKMIKTHGHHFRIPKKFDTALSKLKSGQTLMVVASGIRWTSSKMASLSEQKLDISQQYGILQRELVKEAISVASSYSALVDVLAQILAELDVYASLAHVAATSPAGEYSLPTVKETSDCLFIPQARHPILELQHQICDSFVPNTHDMHRSTSRVQVLTGPNMSGKSTFARQLGLCCVMAQMGSYIPCQSQAIVPIVDAVLARVGASDCQLGGLSTFMTEMTETASILQVVTDRSLVIVDELGRGTSTYDGFGLAWAISEHLAKETKAWVIFATHFQEMTRLADALEQVINIHVQAQIENDEVLMLHQVKPGKCEESFGINIAKLAGFPSEVILDAKAKLAELDQFKGVGVYTEDYIQQVNKRLKLLGENQKQLEMLDDTEYLKQVASMIS